MGCDLGEGSRPGRPEMAGIANRLPAVSVASPVPASAWGRHDGGGARVERQAGRVFRPDQAPGMAQPGGNRRYSPRPEATAGRERGWVSTPHPFFPLAVDRQAPGMELRAAVVRAA